MGRFQSESQQQPDYELLSDGQLMRRVRDDDFDAFEALVRRHHHSVYGVAYRMLGDATEAEDLTQQTFLRIFNAAGRYEPSARFTTWMFTIVRNLVFNELRRRGSREHVSIDSSEEGGDGIGQSRQIPDMASLSPDAVMLHAELESEVQAALETLPEQQRMAMVLLRYEELSYEEIARTLQTSLASVKSLVFRARETLRTRLKKYLNFTATNA